MANILNSIHTIFKSSLIVLFLISGCSQSKLDKTNNSHTGNSIPELFKLAYNSKDNSILFKNICTTINDSLQTYDNVFAIRTIDEINYNDSTVNWLFANSTYWLPHFNENLAFIVKLKNNTLYYKNKKIEVIEIRNYYRELIAKFNENEDVLKDNQLPFRSFILKIEPIKKISDKEWHLIFNCINEFVSFCNERNDLLSEKKFKKEYQYLNFSEKESIQEENNYTVFIIIERQQSCFQLTQASACAIRSDSAF